MTDKKVKLPKPLWRAMEPKLRRDLVNYDPSRQSRFEEYGFPVFIRLKDKSEHLVHVNWSGEIVIEEYRGMGYRGDASGPPCFTADDIESWGFRDSAWKPTFLRPLRKLSHWRVLAWVDGRVECITKGE